MVVTVSVEVAFVPLDDPVLLVELAKVLNVELAEVLNDVEASVLVPAVVVTVSVVVAFVPLGPVAPVGVVGV